MSHTCHWIGCEKNVPPSMWGCKQHWYMLPNRIRLLILKTYRKGQEITKTPSLDYLKVALLAQVWIANETDKVNGTNNAEEILVRLNSLIEKTYHSKTTT